MFDGSELSAVYGDSQLNNDVSFPPPSEVQNTQSQVPPDVKYSVPEQTYQQQTPHTQPEKVQYVQQESFWDRMGYKKADVFKLFMFALVILLAISMDKLLFHYLKNYIEENMMNSTNEFLIRLCYPISIVVVIWILKSL